MSQSKMTVYVVYIIDKLTKHEFIDKIYGDELVAQEAAKEILDNIKDDNYEVEVEAHQVHFAKEV